MKSYFLLFYGWIQIFIAIKDQKKDNYDKEQLKKFVEKAKKGMSTMDLPILCSVPEATIRAKIVVTGA